MTQYIEKSAVVAEIERLSAYLDTLHEQRIVEKILSIIDTLEVKEVDLEKEVNEADEYLGDIIRESIDKLLSEDGIHIKPENKGKFTATMKRTGKPAEELKHSKNQLTRKRANFAMMAKRHWKPLKKKDKK